MVDGLLHDETNLEMENDPRQWWRMVDDTAGVLHDDNQLRETKLKGAKVLR